MPTPPNDPKLDRPTKPPVSYEGGMEPLEAGKQRRGLRHGFLWLALHSWRRRVSLALAACVLVIAGLVVQQVRLNDELDDARRTSDARIERTQGRVADAQSDIDSQREAVFDAAEIARDAEPSIFTIGAGDVSGTAFALFEDGDDTILVTNRHVIEELGAKTRVELYQGDDEYPGEVIARGRGEANDVALVRIGERIPVLRDVISEDDDLEEGQAVLAYGSPLGLNDTKTQGIISAIRADFIQFDAQVNPGNSGGPLLNGDGHVIGIVTGELAEEETSGSTGLSVALDIAIACQLADDELPDLEGCD